MTEEVLRGMVEGAVKGLEELAPGIAEYQYHSSMMAAVIAGIVILASVVALVIGIKMGRKDEWDGVFPTLLTVVAIGVLIVAFTVFICELNDIYLAKYYPEKLVIRELKYLMSNF